MVQRVNITDFFRPIKVLIVSTNSDQSGAPIHVETLVKSLKDNVEFRVIFGEYGPVAARLEELGLVVLVIPKMRSAISPFWDLVCFFKLAKEIYDFKPDLIHAHSSKAGMLARISAFLFNIPSIYTVHGWGWRGLNSISSTIVKLIEKLFIYIHRSYYIFVSKSVLIEGEDVLGPLKNKSQIIYNGVSDLGELWQKSTRMQIIMPARVCDAKDHESLIRAFEILDFDAELVLCGGGTDCSDFLSKTKDWAPSKFTKIHLLGSRSDVPRLLIDSQVFVLISNFEALPISIIEAMRAGMPIVATNVGGVSELIHHNKNGILVNRGDISNIVAALKFFSNMEKREKFGFEARKSYLNTFQADEMASLTLAYYRTVLVG